MVNYELTDLMQQHGRVKSSEWSLLSRFEHHSIATCQSRTHLPGKHEEREVPGDDLTHHTDGLAQYLHMVRPITRDNQPVYFVSPSYEILQSFNNKII